MKKKCPKCGKVKERSLFYMRSPKTPWVNSSCKSCHSKLVVSWKEKNKDRVLITTKKYRDRCRQEVIEFFGSKCMRCGFDDTRALQIDHIAGGGRKDRASYSSIQEFYKKVIEEKANKYQLLCANCNQIKRLQNMEHRTKKQ